jgi:hypothetical protein
MKTFIILSVLGIVSIVSLLWGVIPEKWTFIVLPLACVTFILSVFSFFKQKEA